MKLESFHKPLDYDAEGRKNLEGTYSQDPDFEIDNYDLLFDELDPYTVALLRGEIDDDDKAALDAARSEATGIAAMIAESDKRVPWSATDIGKEFINTPTTDKMQAEQQAHYDLQTELEISGAEFEKIAREKGLLDMDPELQAELERMAAELENMF